MISYRFVAAFALASLVIGGVAQAHTKIVASTPLADAAVAPISAISMTFNEKAIATFSGAEVIMTAMPGMANHKPMKLNGLKPSWSADGKTLTLTAGRVFPKGTYRVSWHAAGADAHRMQGSYSFSVK